MDTTDMTVPVTLDELREELALLKQGTHQQLSSLDEKHSRNFEIWRGALLEHIEEGDKGHVQVIRAAVQAFEERLTMRLSAVIAQQFGALRESMNVQFAAFHAAAFGDLPRRVSRLEAAVFPAPE